MTSIRNGFTTPSVEGAGAPVADRLTTTRAQQRLLKIYDLGERFRSIHNIGGLFRIEGEVHADRLEAALGRVMARHGLLRARFGRAGGETWLEVASAASCRVPFECHDIAGVETPLLLAAFREVLRQPFDVYREPPWKIHCFRSPAGRVAVMLVMHHLVSDYQTVAIVINEMVHAYDRLGTGAADDAAAAADEAAQRHYADRESAAVGKHLQELRDRVAGVRPLDLFGKRVPLSRRSFDFDHALFPIPADLAGKIAGLAAEQGVSAASVYLAAYSLLLLEAGGQAEFLVGFPVDGRSDRSGLGAAGFLSAPSLLRIALDLDDTVVEACRQNSREMRRAFRTRFVPLAEVFHHPDGEAGAGVQALFSFVNTPHEAVGRSIGVDRVMAGIARSDVDVWLTIVNKNNELHGLLELSLDLADRQQMEHLAGRYLALLAGIAAEPGARVASLVAAAPGRRGLHVDVVASFSAAPLADPAAFWCDKGGYPGAVALLPYQQVVQSLVGERPADVPADALFCLLRLGDFFRSRAEPAVEAEYDELIHVLVDALAASLATRGIPHVAVLCPTAQRPEALVEAEARLARALAAVPGLKCLDLTGLTQPGLFFPERDRLAHVPYHDDFYEYLAIEMARELYLLRRPGLKVLVLDCDNTLWRGVVGEDGIGGVAIEAGHLELQRRVVALQQAGVLVTLCSKNDHALVEALFRQRADMVLQWDHLAATRISWDSKADAIASLARELNLGLDSFLFLDDNPLEIIEVQHRLPEVLCLRLPDDPVRLAAFVTHLWPLSVMAASREDGQRTRLYQTEARRQALARQVLSPADFIASLEVRVDIRPLGSDTLARACQLSQRTNQFNLTGLRHTEGELLALMDSPEHVLRVVGCEDKFGSYGDVGLLIARCRAGTLELVNLALSCRAMGRGVELEMVRELGRIAQSRGLDRVALSAVRTPRNTPAMNFVRSLAGQGEATDDLACAVLAPAAACRISREQMAPAAAGPLADPVVPGAPGIDRVQEADRLRWIAEHLALRRHGAAAASAPAVTARDVADAVRDIWTRLLKRPPASEEAAFAGAGLDSLGAVDFVLRLERSCGVSLSLDAFYGARTFAGLCDLVRRQSRGAPPGAAVRMEMFEDMELSFAEVPALASPPPPVTLRDARYVLLTGASGFVGVHLLAELLRQSEARIVCLVRGDSDSAARDRIRATLAEHRLDLPEAAWRRVVVLAGDLARDDLGLGARAFAEWAGRIDLVIHCAAEVNFFKSYAGMRPANVLGTRTLLRFCAAGRIKPLHFVSTLGVFHSRHLPATGRLPESPPAEALADLPSGYQQSKYVAECLVARARERGMPVTVIRLGTIAGNARTGRMNLADFFVSLNATIHEMGVMPEMRDLDFLPVDFVARAIVAIADADDAPGRIFHLVHPEPLPPATLRSWYELGGYRMQMLPPERWIEAATHFVAGRPGHHFAVFVPLLAARGGERSLFDILLKSPPVACHNAQALLARAGIVYPPLSQELLQRYLGHYRDIGWLPVPAAQQDSLMRFPEHLRGHCAWAGLPGADADHLAAAAAGEAAGDAWSLHLVSHIDSLAQLLEDKRVHVTGSLRCPLLHPEPVRVRCGHWQIKPHDGYRPEDDDSLIFLRYRLDLVDADGRGYLAVGHKVSRNLAEMFFESQTLNLRICPDGKESGPQVVGRVTLPFAEFVRDQIDHMQFRAGVDARLGNRYKLLWLAFLGGELASNYLSLGLRRGDFSFQDLRALLEMLGLDRAVQDRLEPVRRLLEASGYLGEYLQSRESAR